jgi:hypothetical protein
MSKFKPNSRFSSLVEKDNSSIDDKITINKNKKNNVNEKKDIQEIKNYDDKTGKKINGNYNSERSNTSFKDNRNKIEEDKLKNTLSIENFPELISKPVNIIPINYTSFSEKLKSEIIANNSEKVEDSDYKILMPGWTLIKRDTTTNKIITKKKDPLEVFRIDNSEKVNILNDLVELHEKRNNEYIDMWGCEEWEHMFRFPNYDYNYFEKLDELYYQEIDNEESEDDEEYDEYTTDYDTFNNY